MKLTPNRRLAVYLKEELTTTVPVFAITDWLEASYDAYALQHPDSMPYRLNATEEMIIWERIIQQSKLGDALFNLRGTAKMARDAWVLSSRWRLLETALHQTEDSLVYKEWQHQYQQDCQKMFRVDTASFVDELIASIEKNRISLPPDIELVGFEELTPQWQELLAMMAKQGVKISQTSLVSKIQDVYQVAAKDFDEELRLAALYAKRKLQEQLPGPIGIVVPDLEQNRASVVRLLTETLPIDCLNIAAPPSLLEYPLINNVLLVLSLIQGKNTFEKWSLLLRSPFIQGAFSKQIERAVVDVACRQRRQEMFSLTAFAHQMVKGGVDQDFLAIVTHLEVLQKQGAAKHLATDWIVLIRTLLTGIGWPGETLLNSDEQLISAQLERLFNEYIQMESVLGMQTYQEACQVLSQLAGTLTFLPPVAATAKIHVLGLLEAAGLPFQALWITGLHREAWPKAPNPNPFIPLPLQRAKDLPRSHPLREFKMAKQLTERLSMGAPTVIFSYPSTADTGLTTISSLLKALPKRTPLDLGLSVKTPFFKTENDQYLPYDRLEKTFPVLENSLTMGGALFLRHQAACPFKAFASIRLKAAKLPQPVFALTESDRGEIVHTVLQVFWQQFATLSAVQALSTEALNTKIEEAIQVAFTQWEKRGREKLPIRYLSLEKARIFRLVSRFIAVEKAREPFSVVGCEVERVLTFQGLTVKVRLDRIDRLNDNTEILIDYKTGNATLSDWFGERPRDPQLPFYCITHEAEVSGIAYGMCRLDEVKLKGLSKADKDWEMHCDTWGETISALACNFRAGIADVSPSEGEKTCRQCHLQPLCRVND